MANAGVKLLAPESSTTKVLDDFKDAGVEVLACGLCVEYYRLKQGTDRANNQHVRNLRVLDGG